MNVITSGDGDDYFIEQDKPVSISKDFLIIVMYFNLISLIIITITKLIS